MFSVIKVCEKCSLYKNQRPLLDKTINCQVMWIGLSAKQVVNYTETPLSPNTNSGKLLSQVEELCKNVSMYRTNLVKCLPLDSNDKIRYPTRYEMHACIPNLEIEVTKMNPKIVFCLGAKVVSAIEKYFSIKMQKASDFNYNAIKHNEVWYVPIHHPSYIYIYKHKQIDAYVNSLTNIIKKTLNNKGNN